MERPSTQDHPRGSAPNGSALTQHIGALAHCPPPFKASAEIRGDE